MITDERFNQLIGRAQQAAIEAPDGFQGVVFSTVFNALVDNENRANAKDYQRLQKMERTIHGVLQLWKAEDREGNEDRIAKTQKALGLVGD